MYCFFFLKKKTAYEVHSSDWSSDVFFSYLPSWLIEADRRHCPRRSSPDARGAQGSGIELRGRQGRHSRPVHDPAARRHGGARQDQTDGQLQIGRASGRDRVCQYLSISVVAVYLKKQKNIIIKYYITS